MHKEFRCQTYQRDLRADGNFHKVPRMMAQKLWYGDPRLQWNRIVQDYCKRPLTKEEDKLIAISGIAKVFQSRMLDDAYVAGLWYNSFPLGPLWKVSDPDSITRPASYRAPSWSWASIDGGISPCNTVAAKTRACSVSIFSIQTLILLAGTQRAKLKEDRFEFVV